MSAELKLQATAVPVARRSEPSPETAALVALEKTFRPTPLWKRCLDIVGASSAIVLLMPLFGCVALTVKLSSKGPIFFRQWRHGAAGQLFYMWKFRTMDASVNANEHRLHVSNLSDSEEPLRKNHKDEHLIPGGRLLRAVGIDELPQLWNVLRGEMSLVGPRPDVLSLQDYEPWQLRRFEVVPGITGYWQVHGKNRTTFDEMMRLDIEYVDRRSPWLDAQILLKTMPALIRLAVD